MVLEDPMRGSASESHSFERSLAFCACVGGFEKATPPAECQSLPRVGFKRSTEQRVALTEEAALSREVSERLPAFGKEATHLADFGQLAQQVRELRALLAAKELPS
jgi:hypothetical protein